MLRKTCLHHALILSDVNSCIINSGNKTLGPSYHRLYSVNLWTLLTSNNVTDGTHLADNRLAPCTETRTFQTKCVPKKILHARPWWANWFFLHEIMGEAGEIMVTANQNQCPFNIITCVRQKKTCLIPHPDWGRFLPTDLDQILYTLLVLFSPWSFYICSI